MAVKKDPKLIRIDKVQVALGATSAEVERWVEMGRIPIAEMRTFNKWGKTLKARMFDEEAVQKASMQAEKWREDDKSAKATATRQRREDNAEVSRQRKMMNGELRKLAGMRDYPGFFPKARELQRKLVFFSGPTNSGKTFRAMEMARSAATAEVLSPLRMLAMEHFDKLRSYNLSAGMVTGEEALGEANATHLSRTIECADFERVVEVAIIDEVQMLDDRDRGWAWTSAVFGLPAKTVVMTGSPEALPLVKKFAEMTGEDLEVVTLERKSRLEIMNHELEMTELQPGDALVVFSKNDLQKCREIISDIGKLTSAAIYGALGPEVRRAEAERFASGKADVLVATDAIGMGMNLPIKRILFTSTKKFDGKSLRSLTLAELNQIAGRAGRHGYAEVGYAGTARLPRRSAELSDIRRAIDVYEPSLRAKFLVRPSPVIVDKASTLLGTDSLTQTLVYLKGNLAKGNPRIELSDLTNQIDLAQVTDRYPMSIRQKYGFACAPCDPRDDWQVSAFEDFIKAYADGELVKPPKMDRQQHLDFLETLAKTLSLYLWLARKYPDAFPFADDATQERSRVQDRIQQIVAEQGKVTNYSDPRDRQRAVEDHLSERRCHFRANARDSSDEYDFDDDDEGFDDFDFDWSAWRSKAPAQSQRTKKKQRKRRRKKKNMDAQQPATTTAAAQQ